MFLNSINYFRAIAILFIVISHSVEIFGLPINSIFDKVLLNIIDGGAIFFVFISGFLFFHVFYSNFDYKNFIAKKVKYIVIPYFVLSSMQILYSIFASKKFSSSNHSSSILYSYVTGATLTGYYYIPFIIIIFLLSPLFVRFIRTNIRMQIALILLTLSIALLIHRPLNNINIFQAVLYFSPVYLLGIFSSIYKDYIYKIISGREYVLLFIAIFLAVFQAIFYSHFGSFDKEPFEFNGIDIMLLQKISLTLFFVIFLHRFENVNCPALNFLAKVSFPIFFLNPFVIKTITHLNKFLPDISASHGGILFWGLSAMLVAGCSAIIAVTIKKFLPKYSVFLIGR